MQVTRPALLALLAGAMETQAHGDRSMMTNRMQLCFLSAALLASPAAAKADPKVFTLSNGQRCFVAESDITFCTDRLGRFVPNARPNYPDLTVNGMIPVSSPHHDMIYFPALRVNENVIPPGSHPEYEPIPPVTSGGERMPE